MSLNRQQTKEVHQSEIEDIFKNCVTDKVKHSQNLLKEANKKANMKEMMEPSPQSRSPGDHTVLSSLSPSRAAEDPAVEFRKNVAKDLLDITNKLQRIRDKLSVREKKPDL